MVPGSCGCPVSRGVGDLGGETRTAYAEGVEQLAPEVSEVAGRRVAVVGELDPPFEGDPSLRQDDHPVGLLGYITRITEIPDQAPAGDLDEARSAVATVVGGLNSTNRRAVLSGEYPFDVTAGWIVRHLVHDLQHHLLDIRRGYARLAMADHDEVYTVSR